MSIYDNAGVALIPSGTKASKLYSVLPANGDGDFTHSRGSTATRVNKDGFIESVATNVPRLDYPLIDGVVQDCPALLLEPSRTNSIPYSNLFTYSGWSKAGSGTGSTPTVTGDYAISPDGSQNASRLQLDKGSGNTLSDYSFLYETVTSVGTGSISIWMKSNDSNTYQVALRMVNYTVCDVTPEWQRFELNNQSSTNEIQIMLRGTFGTSDNADILIYGAQLEAGSYVTSYIPTSGSAVTRSADACNGSGTSAEFDSQSGALFAEFKTVPSGGNFLISIADGTSNTGAVFVGADANEKIYSYYNSAYHTSDIDSFEHFNKIVNTWDSSGIKIYINGFSRTVSGSQSLSSSDYDNLRFSRANGSLPFYGDVKQVMTFKTKLTDSELETLTSWDSFNAMAKGQLYTIE